MSTSRLREQLAAELARQIVSGELSPETTLPSESALISDYEVSKTVARESIQLLASVGLVNVQHGKLSEVTDHEEWDILSPLVQQAFLDAGLGEDLVSELHEVRQLLEPQAAAQAALRSTPEDHDRLATIVEGMTRSAAADGSAGFLNRDREFHLAIVACGSHNRALSGILRDVYSIFHSGEIQLSEESLHSAVEQHAAIASAIREGDAAAADQLMRDHLAWAGRQWSLAGLTEEPSAVADGASGAS